LVKRRKKLNKNYFKEDSSLIELEKNFINTLNGNHFNKSKQLKFNVINFSKFASKVIENLNSEFKLKLDNKIESLKNIQKNLEEKRFRIAVFGFFASGKSTFLNALMGIDKLPMDEDRTTATFTILKHIKNRNKSFSEYLNSIIPMFSDKSAKTNQNQIEIVYKNKKDISILYKESLDKLGFDIEKDKKYYQFEKLNKFKNEFLSKIENIKLKDFDISERDNVKNGKKILKFILTQNIPYGKTIKIKKEEATQYLTDDNKAIAISEVIYYLDNDLLKDVEIVDTPGFGSENTLDTIKTQQFLKEVDAVILLTDAKAPLGTKVEQEFLENYAKIFEKENKTIDTSKLFVIINKIDLTNKNRNEIKKLLFKSLKDNWEDDFKIDDKHIFTLSAKYHLDLLTKNNSKIYSKNINKDDLENFKRVYSSYLTKEKDKTLISSNFKKIDKVLFEIENSLREEVSKTRLEIEELKKKKEKFIKNKKEIIKKLKVYNDAMFGINFQLSEYVKKRLNTQKLSGANAVERTTKAYVNYLGWKGLKKYNATEENAKEFYKRFLKSIYNRINSENIEIFQKKLKEKIELLNKEIKELENEYNISIENKINLNSFVFPEKELENIEFEKGFFNSLFDIFTFGTWVDAKDYAEQMVEMWNKKHYNFLYDTIMQVNHELVKNIVNEFDKQINAIIKQIDIKTEKLEKELIKEKEELEKEYQKRFNIFQNVFNNIEKYKYKIANQYKELYLQNLYFKR
jgi:energy-coupling factor transporter ATP-binding protein EcfA2